MNRQETFHVSRKIFATLNAVPPVDPHLYVKAQAHLDRLTKPVGSLGRLEEFARRLIAIGAGAMPSLSRKAVFTFAGDHGVSEEGVSAFPKEVTYQMVLNILNGGAGVNVLARHASADVIVIDIGVDYDFDSSLRNTGRENGAFFVQRKIVRGTGNIRKGNAMSRQETERCIETGIEIAHEYGKKGYGLFAVGEMGIGNTTPSSAIAAVLTGRTVRDVTGRGTGVSNEIREKKIRMIEEAISLNNPDAWDAVDVLSKVGGAEIAGIAGFAIGAASMKIPLIIDGFICTAGALTACRLEPRIKDFLFAAHNSVEPGHRAMLDAMELKPILDLDLRLGEGTGAALAIPLIEAAMKIYTEMATFGGAGVSEKKEE